MVDYGSYSIIRPAHLYHRYILIEALHLRQRYLKLIKLE